MCQAWVYHVSCTEGWRWERTRYTAKTKRSFVYLKCNKLETESGPDGEDSLLAIQNCLVLACILVTCPCVKIMPKFSSLSVCYLTQVF